jgi:hypothetical protein
MKTLTGFSWAWADKTVAKRSRDFLRRRFTFMASLEQLSTDMETIKELILDYPTQKRASFNSPLSSA